MKDTIEIDGVTYRKIACVHGSDKLIRTRSAGVHMGEVIEDDGGTRVVLAPGAVRIWRWRGANTLTELAKRGCESAESSGYTRISEPSAARVTLTEAIEILEVTEEASQSIRSAGWAK